MSEDRKKSKVSAAPKAKAGAGKTNESVPKWRQIEVLKEKRALKDELADLWLEDPDIDDAFFVDEDNRYRQNKRASKMSIELPTDDDIDLDDDLD